MPLGTKVGLGPGHLVLHGDPAPPPKRGTASQFLAHVYCGRTVVHLSYCWALVWYINQILFNNVLKHLLCSIRCTMSHVVAVLWLGWLLVVISLLLCLLSLQQEEHHHPENTACSPSASLYWWAPSVSVTALHWHRAVCIAALHWHSAVWNIWIFIIFVHLASFYLNVSLLSFMVWVGGVSHQRW